HTWRRQGGAGRLCRNSPALRRRYASAPGQARSALETHRALLRGLSDHPKRSEGFGDDAAGVTVVPSCPPTGRPNGRPMTGSGGHPVNTGVNNIIPAVITGSSAFA